MRGEFCAYERAEVDHCHLHTRVCACCVLADRAPQFCPDGVWRHSPERCSASRDSSILCQCQDHIRQKPSVLASDGTGLSHLAGVPGDVDIL